MPADRPSPSAPVDAICVTCKGPVDQHIIDAVAKAKRKLGQRPTPPKRCSKCLWDAIEKMCDEPEDPNA